MNVDIYKSAQSTNVNKPISPKMVKFSNIILGTAALFFMLIFFYAIFYQYERYLIGPNSTISTLLLYYIMPATAAVLLLISLSRQPSFKINLALLVLSSGVSIGIGLYIVELFLLIWVTSGPQRAAMKADIKKVDTRTKLEVIQDLRSQGIDAYPSVHPIELLVDQPDGSVKAAIAVDDIETLPLGGIANTITVYCNENGEYLIYKSDEHGFHEPHRMWDTPQLDIAIVGDSFIQGSCVPSDKNIAARIRERYSATLNLGNAGNGPLLMLAGVQEFLPALRPKNVLWFYYEGNDLSDLKREKKSSLLMNYLESDFHQGLRDKQIEIDQSLRTYVDAAIALARAEQETNRGYTEHIRRFIKLNDLRIFIGLINRWTAIERSADYALFDRILRKTDTTVESWGGKLCFVYLPEQSHYYGFQKENPNRDRVREQILAQVRAAGIPIVDVHEAFLAHGNPATLFPYPGAHYNIEGHKVAAQAVLDSPCLVE